MQNNRTSRGRSDRPTRHGRIVPADQTRRVHPVPALVNPWTYVYVALALGGAVLAQDALTALVRLLT